MPAKSCYHFSTNVYTRMFLNFLLLQNQMLVKSEQELLGVINYSGLSRLSRMRKKTAYRILQVL